MEQLQRGVILSFLRSRRNNNGVEQVTPTEIVTVRGGRVMAEFTEIAKIIDETNAKSEEFFHLCFLSVNGMCRESKFKAIFVEITKNVHIYFCLSVVVVTFFFYEINKC